MVAILQLNGYLISAKMIALLASQFVQKYSLEQCARIALLSSNLLASKMKMSLAGILLVLASFSSGGSALSQGLVDQFNYQPSGCNSRNADFGSDRSYYCIVGKKVFRARRDGRYSMDMIGEMGSPTSRYNELALRWMLEDLGIEGDKLYRYRCYGSLGECEDEVTRQVIGIKGY